MPASKRLRGDEANFRALFRSYRKRAKTKKHAFELTPERFRELTTQDCYICGSPPQGKYRHDKRSVYRRFYVYNGIDRVNSREGYVEGNVITCCKICNTGKSDLSLEAYLLHIHQQFNHVIKPALEEGYPDDEQSDD